MPARRRRPGRRPPAAAGRWRPDSRGDSGDSRMRSKSSNGPPHGQLGDEVVTVADTMQHGRPESGLVEGDRVARALDPELRLDARHAGVLPPWWFATCAVAERGPRRPAIARPDPPPGWARIRSSRSEKMSARPSPTTA